MLGPDAWEQKDVLALADELDLEGVETGPCISTAAAPRAQEQVRERVHACWGGTPASWDHNLHGCQRGLVQVQGRVANCLSSGCFGEAVAMNNKGQRDQNQHHPAPCHVPTC